MACKTVGEQQNYETLMMKNILHNVPTWKKAGSQADASNYDALQTGLFAGGKGLRSASVAAVQPVRHSIMVEAAG